MYTTVGRMTSGAGVVFDVAQAFGPARPGRLKEAPSESMGSQGGRSTLDGECGVSGLTDIRPDAATAGAGAVLAAPTGGPAPAPARRRSHTQPR